MLNVYFRALRNEKILMNDIVLQFLNSPDYEGRKSEEVGKLELTILQQKKVSISWSLILFVPPR
jgi:hypothetical protein